MLNDRRCMMRAIDLAKKGCGKTSPNPPVGCVIVKNGRIIAEGYHKKAGQAHAEINALLQTRNARHSTMYVSLEPCDHYGKTPPCTDAIIKSGVKKVFVAAKDPNPINNGRGIKKLKDNGISVRCGVCKNEANAIYRPYIKFITQKKPYITLKIAESIDGKIATVEGESKWITSDVSRSYVHRLRSCVDAVAVGINTVLRDDPLLLPENQQHSASRFPMRIVIDSRLRIPITSRLVKSANLKPLIIATTETKESDKKRLLTKKGALVLDVGKKSNRVDLKKLLYILWSMDIMHVLVEGGGELAGSFFDEHLIDRAIFFIAPKIIGGEKAVSSIRGAGINKLKDAALLKNVTVKKLGEDLVVEGDL